MYKLIEKKGEKNVRAEKVKQVSMVSWKWQDKSTIFVLETKIKKCDEQKQKAYWWTQITGTSQQKSGESAEWNFSNYRD